MKVRMGVVAAAAGGVAAVLLAFTFHADGDPVIDQWPVGGAIDCGSETRCLDLVTAARHGLDQRNPGHAPVTSVTLHAEGAARSDGIITKRSGGCCKVAVFQLADGTIRAIGVGYIGIDPTPVTVDYGP